MMRSLVLTAVMIGLLATAGCKKAKPEYQGRGYAPFEKFQSTEGKFTVQMPGKPKVETSSDSGSTIVAYRAIEDGGGYLVSYSDEPIPVGESESRIQARIDGALQVILRSAGATLTSESNITLAGKYPGREIKAKSSEANQVVYMRLYVVDRRVYRLVAGGNPGWVASPETKQFFDSFTLTP